MSYESWFIYNKLAEFLIEALSLMSVKSTFIQTHFRSMCVCVCVCVCMYICICLTNIQKGAQIILSTILLIYSHIFLPVNVYLHYSKM